MQLIQQSEATAAYRRLYFQAVDATDGITAETGLTGTGYVSKNGGTPAASASISEINSTNMPGRYYVELTTTECNTVGLVEFRFKTSACAEVVARAMIVPWDPFDSVRLGLTALPNAAAEASGGLFTRGSGAGQINQQANGQVDVNIERVRNAVLNALVSGRIDSSVGAMANTVLTAAAIAADAITNAKIAADAIGASEFAQAAADKVWSSVTRALTDKAGFSISGTKQTLDALNDVSAAVVNAQCDQALTDYDPPTKSELDSGFAALNDISAAEVNAEVDAALDTAIPGTPTADSINERLKAIDDKLPSGNISDVTTAQVNTECGNALTTYDPPTKAELDSGLAGLNDVSAAEVNAQCDQALSDYDPPTKAELDSGLAGLNDVSATEVNAEVDTALSDIRLDELMSVALASQPTAGSLLGDLTEDDGGTQRFNANALEQAPGGGGGYDWTSGEKEQIRDALGIDGTKTAATGGDLQALAAAVAGLNDLSSAEVNAACDQAVADYDPPTKAELDSGLAALNDLSAAQVNAEVDQALSDYDAPTKTEMDTAHSVLAAGITAVETDTQDIQSRIPAALVGGRMASDAEAISGSTSAADDVEAKIGNLNATIASRASASVCTEARLSELDAAKIPADVDLLLSRLSAARAGYLDNLNGHVPQTGDAYTRLGTPAGASVSADVAAVKAAIDTDVISELAQTQPPTSPTLKQAVMFPYMALRNETEDTASEKRVKNNAGTVIAKAAQSDDGSKYTKGKFSSGP